MPTYEYECEKCGRFEFFQSITAKPLTRCLCCGAKVQRLIGAGSGVIFKGSGFYETDYKRRSPGTIAGSERTFVEKKEQKGKKEQKN